MPWCCVRARGPWTQLLRLLRLEYLGQVVVRKAGVRSRALGVGIGDPEIERAWFKQRAMEVRGHTDGPLHQIASALRIELSVVRLYAPGQFLVAVAGGH